MSRFQSRAFVFCTFALLAIFGTTATAQTATGIPGPNVNIIGPTPSPLLADTTLKQQNEPSCAVQPGNSQNIFCAYNDYRGVDNLLVNDAWIGASFTRNDGLTWSSRLVPGFKSDVPSLSQEFAADPVVGATPGMVFINFIAAYRDLTQPTSPPSGLYLQRWVESAKEDGAPWEFVDTKRIASGVSGSFLDKPVMVVTVKDGECDEDYDADDDHDHDDYCANGLPVATTLKPGLTKMVVPSVVHVAYAEFAGNQAADTARIYYTQSKNLGATWRSKKELSLGAKFNQGVALATMGDRVLAVWRQFASDTDPDAFIYAMSVNGGTDWSAPAALPLPAGSICPFDQPDELPSSNYAFRSKALPVAVSDGKRLYVFWAQRTGNNCTAGQARIAYLSTDGSNWDTTYTQVDPDTAHPAAHQAMPAAFAAGGVVQVAWVDTRDDEYLKPVSFVSAYIVDTPGLGLTDADGNLINERHTADIYHAQLVDGASRGAVKVSQYAEGDLSSKGEGKQLERNYANPRLFKQATKPFNGDYISAAAPAFRRDSKGAWVSNHGTPASTDIAPKEPSFQVAWADNRDVRSNVYQQSTCLAGATPGSPDCPGSSPYTPTLQGEPGSSATGVCTQDFPGVTDPLQLKWSQVGPQDSLKALSRNQNVYSSVIKPGVVFGSASAAKPANIQRAFVVYLQNTRVSGSAIFDLRLSLAYPGAVPSPNGDRVSFMQSLSGAALQDLIVEVPSGSSAARTVFVTATSVPAPNARVDAYEVTCANPADPNTCTKAFASTIVLTGDPAASSLQNPDCSTAGTCGSQNVQLFETHNPDLIFALYSVQSPSYRNPSLRNPSLRNFVYENPSLRNETVSFPSLRNPSLRNSPITDDSAAQATSYSDFVYDISNTGNTTSAYNLKPLITGDMTATDALGNPLYKPQLIVSRIYSEETAQNCAFVNIDRQQVIINIRDPDVAMAASGDPLADPGVSADAQDATFFVEPGGKAQITLRIWGVDAVMAHPEFKNRVWMAAYSQSLNSDGTAGLKKSFDVIGCAGCTAPDVTPPALPVNPGPPLSGPTIEADRPTGWYVSYAPPIATDPGAVDGFPVNVTCDPASDTGVILPIGPGSVTCAATDHAGNTAEAVYSFTVADTTPPVVTAPANITTEATGSAGAVVTFSSSASDIVDGSVSPTCAPASGSTFAIKTTTVTCTATDAKGNIGTGSFAVTVRDTTAPAVTVPANITIEATGPAGAVATFASSASDTVDGALGTTCTPASGMTFAIGTTTVTCTATDGNGNTGSNAFTVTVGDTTAPVLTVPAPITAEATSSAGAAVAFSASANDVVDGALGTTCAPVSGSTFALGAKTVTCTATDAKGNIGTGSFTVTVRDTTVPVVTVPANITTEATGPAGAAVAFSASAADLVNGALATKCAPGSGSTFGIGTTTVTCTATDGNGNTGSNAFTVTVRDTTAPVLTVPAPITAEATSAAGRVVTFIAVATDLVDAAPVVTCSPISGSTFALGTTIVSCSAKDQYNNTSAGQSFTVKVQDTTPPAIATRADITVNATDAGGAIVTYTAPTATDTVSMATVACAPASGTKFAIGTATVTCTAKDAAGNTATSTFKVTVLNNLYGGILGVYANGSKSVNSSVPLDWYFADTAGRAVASSDAAPEVIIYQLAAAATGGSTCTSGMGTLKVDDPGTSNYRYSSSDFKWQYNWQTKGYTAGKSYCVSVKSQKTKQLFGGTVINLTK